MKVLFDVFGMNCQVCARRINKSVNNVNGVHNCNVNLVSNSMLVDYDEKITNTDLIIKAVVQAGYNAKVKTNLRNKTKKELNFMVVRVVISIILLLPLLYITMFYGKLPQFEFIKYTESAEKLIHYTVITSILTFMIILINFEFYRKGFKNLFKLSPTMDSLISIGSATAFIYSLVTYVTACVAASKSNSPFGYINYLNASYFDSAAMILTIVTIGKTIESKAKHRTTISIEKLVQLIPEYAIVIKNGEEVSIRVEDIKVGDLVVVKLGTRVPVDGTVVDGEATLDTSTITGESIGSYVTKGSKVISSALNQSGLITIHADTIGSDSSMQKIIDLVNEAANSKAPISRIADKVSNFFVPVVIFIALITLIGWLIYENDLTNAINYAVSVLVVSCPCALGLATPVAIMASVGKGASFGIIAKSAEAIECASNIDTVVIDKTGTITEGRPTVIGVNNFNVSEQEVIQVSYSLENGMVHPLSNAIIDYGKKSGYKPYKVEKYEYIAGVGIKGVVNGRNYFLGNCEYIESFTRIMPSVRKTINDYENSGAIPLVLSKENEVVGIVCVADKIKKTSIQAIKIMKDLGIKVIMATGDTSKAANAIGQLVQVDETIPKVLPQDKEKIVKSFQGTGKKKQKVAMIGDGINDSLALVRSDLGVAVASGSDVAIDYGDVVLLRSDLLDASNMFKLARRTMTIIKTNLFWALGYNLISIPTAAGLLNGLGVSLNPMMSAFAMSLSSILVVCTSLTLNLFKPTKYNIIEEEINMGGNTMQEIIKVGGMSCCHCAARVKKGLEALPNVKNVEVDLSTKEVKIEYVDCLNLSAVKDAVEKMDYEYLG